jgi:uroporphyrinogen decarboxylase
MGLFNDRKIVDSKKAVPVWFMRQAGRYHSHYQNIKKDSDFMTMCKDPKLACEITMGPINDFNFDAAILFSDLLFPLEQLGMGLSYHSGPPTLQFRVENNENLKKLKYLKDSKEYYQFQKDACKLIREKLPKNKTLIGFVGAPFTLYTYAVEGAHSGTLSSSKAGFFDGRFNSFMDLLLPDVLSEMVSQAEGGSEAIALFDTAAGELMLSDYKEFVIPRILFLTKEFKKIFPDKKIIYYSKLTHTHYLDELSLQDNSNSIDVLGIDWRMNLSECLKRYSHKYYIEGNIDPSYLHLPWNILEKKMLQTYNEVVNSGANLDRWIMGLGHGVLQQTPEENVKNAVNLIQTKFLY